MEVTISYQNAPSGFISLYFYKENNQSIVGFDLVYWCVFSMNERLHLKKFLKDHGVTHVILLNITSDDLHMLTYLSRHFDFSIGA